jgi:hypothetical protein
MDFVSLRGRFPMMTIQLPPELEGPLAEAARKLGMTPEALVLESLRERFGSEESGAEREGETLFDFLAGHVGTVSGTTEALSEECGRRFAEGLIEERERGRL